jgi:hypothetical protein
MLIVGFVEIYRFVGIPKTSYVSTTYFNVCLFDCLMAVSYIGAGENHGPVTNHSQTLNVVHLVLVEIRTHNISGDIH